MSAPPVAPGPALVVCPDTLGDLTLRQPLFSGLVDRGHPTTVLLRPGYEELLPYLDRRLRWLTIDVDPARLPDDATRRALGDLEDALAEIAAPLVVTTTSPRTPIEDWVLARSGSAVTVGLQASPAVPRSEHADRWLAAVGVRPVEPHLAVVRAAEDHDLGKADALLAAVTGRPADGPPAIRLEPASRVTAARVLETLGLRPGAYVVLCPGGSVHARVKRYAPDAFAEAASVAVSDERLPLLVVGSDAEAPVVEATASGCRARGLEAVAWTGGAGTLGTLLGLLAEARLYLGADTGPMHFAGALGVPVAAAFGGGHWPRFLPVAPRSFVATQRLPCFGCGWDCWLDEAACLGAASPATLGRGAADLLAGRMPVPAVHEGDVLPAWAGALIATAAARHRASQASSERRLAELDAHLAARLEALERLTAIAEERAQVIERADRELAARADVIERQDAAHQRDQRALAERDRVLGHPAVRRLAWLLRRLGSLREATR